MAYRSICNCNNYCVALVVLFMGVLLSNAAAASNSFNVMKFGAKPDGKTDSTQAFVKTWASACSSASGQPNADAVMYIPNGRFLIKAVVFRGPCKTRRVTVRIDGTLVAPQTIGLWATQATGFYSLRSPELQCLVVPSMPKVLHFGLAGDLGRLALLELGSSITFNWANNIVISGLTSINSQQTHLVINSCNNVVVRNVKLIAPSESPNTDGIHVQSSAGVTITGSILQTGDDCISIGPGTTNLHISNIKCGPGHGVSIGSLGKELKEDGVQNVTLTNAVFSGSDNGVRIKSWARPSTGFVRNILFQNIIMRNVENPIIIDQNYCPNNRACPNQSSGVKISQVTYRNIQGASATAEAVTFDCSPSHPCTGIRLQNIKLTYMNRDATSSCKNIDGTSSGLLVPQSCL
ncbi:polygalacturonase [Prunus yedoensis var. nudiflora]|uniref:Polygalacturonase n=1 Tax=Prunus yedoensis var. nudiflora TaxID=2094558 RepID=A0A314YEH9_PRUYE|nr:polygalacturonase [Prunus yedoensis var. nudiflora]